MSHSSNLKTRVDEALNQASAASHRAADVVSEKASQAVKAIANEGQCVMDYVTKQADSATDALGRQLQSASDAVRARAPRNGVVGDATKSVASSLDDAGSYLRREGIEGVIDGLANIVRRNPLPAVLVGVAVGYFLSRPRMSRDDD